MNKPEIRILFYEGFPSDLIDEFVETAKDDAYEIILEKRKKLLLNSAWDFFPTIGILIASGLAAGFLNEAGSDIYKEFKKSLPKIKNACLQLLEKLKGLKRYTLKPGKEPVPSDCNLLLRLALTEKLSLNFLFEGKVDLKALKESAEALFRMLTDKDFKSLVENLNSELQNEEKPYTLQFQFDENKNQWRVFDPVENDFLKADELIKEE